VGGGEGGGGEFDSYRLGRDIRTGNLPVIDLSDWMGSLTRKRAGEKGYMHRLCNIGNCIPVSVKGKGNSVVIQTEASVLGDSSRGGGGGRWFVRNRHIQSTGHLQHK